MALYGEDLVRNLGSSAETLENYIAIKSVTRESTNIWHMDYISFEDRARFIIAVLHYWFQMIPGHMAAMITRALGFDASIAETYRHNAFECIGALKRLDFYICGTLLDSCPISAFPNSQQQSLLSELSRFLIQGGHMVPLMKHFRTKEPIYIKLTDKFYPLRLNVDICQFQKWYGVTGEDSWCRLWLREVAGIANEANKTSLCRTHFDFGASEASVSMASTFVSTAESARSNSALIASTSFTDLTGGTDYRLDALSGWVNQVPRRERYGLNVTRFVGKYREDGFPFANIRGRHCAVQLNKPILYPYDRWGYEALVADNNADDSIWKSGNIIILTVVVLLFMALGALIVHSYGRYSERRAARNEALGDAVPTTLQNIELQPLNHATCGRQ